MLTVNVNCTRCGRSFPWALDIHRALALDALPKRCPTCMDEIQERPDVVLDRAALVEYVVRIDRSFAALFASAAPFQGNPTDRKSHRLTVKGDRYGVSWSGRIDLWSHVWPVAAGDVVTFSYNEVRRRVWYVTTERRIARMAILRGGPPPRTVTQTRRVPKDYVPQEGESAVAEREEVNHYCLLTQTLDSTAAALQTAPSAGSNGHGRGALPALCWLEAHSKTTLKGLGCQFERRIEGTPMFFLDVHGGCRSARYGTYAMLAVVDPADPLEIVMTGDYKGTVSVP